MKKAKAILWGIIVLFLVMVYFQNRAFFEAKNSLMLDIYITDAYHSPELVTAVWVLGALVLGFLIAYFFSLTDKFKTKKLVKGLKANLKTREEMIEQLKKELGVRPGYPQENAVDADVVSGSPLPESTDAPSEER